MKNLLSKLSNVLYRIRYVMLVLFIFIFISATILQNKADISYSFNDENKILDIFKEEKTIVLVYNNSDEENIPQVVSYLSQDEFKEHVSNINTYSNTIGVKLPYQYMSSTMQMDSDYCKSLYQKKLGKDDVEGELITIYDFTLYLQELVNGEYYDYTTDEERNKINESAKTMINAKNSLVSDEHSLLSFNINYESETKEIDDFFDNLNDKLDEILTKKHYLVGDDVMSNELGKTFHTEYLLISILSAIAIFIVICISFRKILIPLILVLIIECSVFITMTYMYFTGSSMYFLALIIVQGMLIGSMVDYGIVMSNYYMEVRTELSIKETIPTLFKKALPTILTSGTIMIMISFIIGAITDDSISTIIFTLGVGTLTSLILIIFVLPSLLTVFDRFAVAKIRKRKDNE